MTDHKNIYAALAAAQMQMGRAVKDSQNPAFRSKYADLASVMDACMAALNGNGIAVFQPTVDEDGHRYVKTILAHVSGETLECRVPLIVQKNDMQGFGSAVTYARRYGLMGMAGIAADDDDGNAAAKAAPKHDEKPVVENPSAAALDSAWRDAVEDSLPPDATPRQKAEAYAEAIMRDFRSKGMKALEASWSKRGKLIDSMKERHPDLFDQIVDAFEMRRNELTDNQGIAAQ